MMFGGEPSKKETAWTRIRWALFNAELNIQVSYYYYSLFHTPGVPNTV
jgi:hypothetical protein